MSTNKPDYLISKIFSGINYLEALSKVPVDDLARQLSDDVLTATSGSVISADTDSIFNKFSIFKYSNFINGAVYQPNAHFIGYQARLRTDPNNRTVFLNSRFDAELQNQILEQNKVIEGLNSQNVQSAYATSNLEEKLAKLDQYRQSAETYRIRNESTIANPTARNILNWASTQSMDSVTGFQPYAMTDFIFCKNYGKIPNNRLITLRRYPFPIDDMLRVPGKRNPIPIAQAVTWFGEGSENSLANIGVMNWGLRWEPLTVDEAQLIDGNEVTVTELLNVFSKIPELKDLGKAVETIYVGLNGDNAQLAQLTKMEQKFIKYSKELYTPNGPYWNRVFGPVNVVNSTTRRARGMQDGWNVPFELKFHYSFRSFNGLSPKIVALDLIASFLNLTYNDAQFLGQLARYFVRPGVKFDETLTQTLGKLLTDWGTNFTTDLGSFMSQAQPLIDAIKAAVSKTVSSDVWKLKGDAIEKKGLNLLQAGSMSLLAGAIPNLISVKSALSDRPIGEWHIVVGNPMNPIMVMGDLICSNCTLKFDEEMGPDDFPTGCTFTVRLAQGKPRDKVAIERMFNLGEAKMMFNKMRNPSSAEDTHGEKNNHEYADLEQDKELDKATREQVLNAIGTSSFTKYRSRIRKSYGYNYASDDIDKEDSGLNSKVMDDSLLFLYFDRSADRT